MTIVTFGPEYKTITDDCLPAATDTLLSAAGAETPRVVIDLSRTEFFGSSFIEVLFRVWKRLNHRGGRFALCHVSPYCLEVLKITHLDSLWPIRQTIPDAIAATRTEA